jgi:hypothetical protein
MGAGNAVARKLRERGTAEHIVREGAEGLIARWRTFISQVEAGYPLGLEDYRNDLDIRSLIAFTTLDHEVASEDDRFRKLLIHTRQAVWESDTPQAFWVRGYPKNASGALLNDLRHEGLAT